MNSDMHGKKVTEIVLDSGTVIHDPATTGLGAGAGLELSATYHGDRDEFWIVEHEAGGKELRRFNCKNVAVIKWA